MVPPVEGADTLEEAVVDDHAAPELARGCGAEETEGRADDAQGTSSRRSSGRSWMLVLLGVSLSPM